MEEYKTTRSSFVHVMKREGSVGLYKGFFVFGPGAVASRVMQFATFEFFRSEAKKIQKDFLPDLHETPFLSTFATNVIGGSLSGLITMLVWTPSEVISQRQSVRLGQYYHEFLYRFSFLRHVIYLYFVIYFEVDANAAASLPKDFHILPFESIADIYRGFGLALTLSVLFGATFFALSEGIKQHENLRIAMHRIWGGSEFAENMSIAVIAGFVGGFGGAVVTSPLDVVKTIKQVHNTKGSSLKIFQEVIDQYGSKGLFRGAVPRIGTLTPSATISYAIFELSKHIAHEENQVIS